MICLLNQNGVPDVKVFVEEYKTWATISWNTSVAESGASIACIENYNVTVCEIQNNDKCIGPESIKMILSQVKHNITGLTECTNYTLIIQPQFSNTTFQDKEVKFDTSCTPPGKY